MYKDLKTALSKNNINFPKHWDQKLSVEFFIDNDSEDYAELLWTTPAKLKSILLEIFPERPKSTSINKYFKNILAQIGEELDVSPSGIRYQKFTQIYKLPVYSRPKALAELSIEELADWEIFLKDM